MGEIYKIATTNKKLPTEIWEILKGVVDPEIPVLTVVDMGVIRDILVTEMISQFGSTACKALWKCLDCKEPFDYFKCI